MQTLREWLCSIGYSYVTPILDSKVHRFVPEGRKGKDGWYIGSEVVLSNGRVGETITLGDYSTGLKESFSTLSSKDGQKFNDGEVSQLREAQEKLAKAAEEERLQKQKDCALKSRMMLSTAEFVTGKTTHPYLERKKLVPKAEYSIKIQGESLLVPVSSINGDVVGLQKIGSTGEKQFLPGTKKRGSFHLIGKVESATTIVGVCEGFATGATLYNCLNIPMFIAFDSGNLSSVGKVLRERYPTIGICFYADNDVYGEVNVGLESAVKAAGECGGQVKVPSFKDSSTKPTDFNDLFCLEGGDAVRGVAVFVSDCGESAKEERQTRDADDPNSIDLDSEGVRGIENVKNFLEKQIEEKERGFGYFEKRVIERIIKRFFYQSKSPVSLAKNFMIGSGFLLKDKTPLLRYYQDDFYRYKGSFYQKLDDEWVVDRINRWLIANDWKMFAGTNRVSSIFNVLKIKPQYVPRQVLLPAVNKSADWMGDWESNKTLIPLRNGALDVSDMSIKPHSPRNFYTYSLPFDYNPKATCSVYDALLKEIFSSDDEIDLWNEVLGMIIHNPLLLEKFIILWGEGANGKSVLVSILSFLLGKDNVSNVTLDCFNSSNFTFIDTLGKLANIVPDMKDMSEIDEGTLKAYISKEEVHFNRKNKPAIRAKPTAFIVACTNTLPRFSDRSDGIWRRLILFKFEKQVAEKDQRPEFKTERFWVESGELPGIFNRALEGIERVKKNGGLTKNKQIETVSSEYRDSLNPVAQFIKECMELGVGLSCPGKSVYDSYKAFVRENGNQPISANKFWHQLREDAKKLGYGIGLSEKPERFDGVLSKKFIGGKLNEFGNNFTGCGVSHIDNGSRPWV